MRPVRMRRRPPRAVSPARVISSRSSGETVCWQSRVPEIPRRRKVRMSIHEDWHDPEAPKRGMSTTAKVLIIVGCVGGVCALLCCGGGLFVYFRLKDALKNAVVLDPRLIEEQTAGIAKIEIPPGFEPKQAVNAVVMRWVVYGKNPDEGSRLLLMGVDRAIVDSANPEGQKTQLLQMMQQEGTTSGSEPGFVVQESEQREIAVRGEMVKFEFAKGTVAANGKEMRQVSGSFKTPGGMGLILFRVPVESYDEAAVVKMLESIADPQPAAAPDKNDTDKNDAEQTDAEQTDAGRDAAPEADLPERATAEGPEGKPEAGQPARDERDGARSAAETPPEK